MSVDLFIKKLETEISDLPKGKLRPETKFIEYHGLWDSLNIVLFIAFAKTEYDSDLETEDIVQARTVAELYNIVLQNKAE